MSRTKGADFENLVAKKIGGALGIKLRRTPMSGGWAKGYEEVAGDLVCVDDGVVFKYCVECKKQEGWRLESLFTDKHSWFDDWWAQLISECPETKIPILVFSRNRQPIFVASYLEHIEAYAPLLVFEHAEDTIAVTTLSFWIAFSN